MCIKPSLRKTFLWERKARNTLELFGLRSDFHWPAVNNYSSRAGIIMRKRGVYVP
jgi:hypothetical protein